MKAFTQLLIVDRDEPRDGPQNEPGMPVTITPGTVARRLWQETRLRTKVQKGTRRREAHVVPTRSRSIQFDLELCTRHGSGPKPRCY